MENELTHHGVVGMKWGVRRYQNPDGTLTALGREKQRSDNIKGNYENARRKVISDGPDYTKTSKYKSARNDQIVKSIEKLMLNDKSRARVHDNIESGKSEIYSYVKGYLGTQVKDLAGIGATTTGAAIIGSLMAGPAGGMAAANIAAIGSSYGIMGTRVARTIGYNMKSKELKEEFKAKK